MDVDLVMDAHGIVGERVKLDRQQFVRPLAAASLIILVFAVWLGLEAPRGTLFNSDELLTAERSREMLLTGSWVVHYNFQRSFEKPPLQYWLTSLTLPRFHNHALALRIWPLVYGILTAIALGWLVFLLRPDEPWLITLTIAILVSAPLFATESARGLLDIGLTFFTTLVFVFAELARKKPAWWMGAAVACWLGSLQKIPLPFLIWVLIVIVRLFSRSERRELQTGTVWLVGSMVLAVALMSLWPLLLLTEYGMPLGALFHDEAVSRLGSRELVQRTYFEVPIQFSLAGGLCGFLSLLAAFNILLSKKERSDAPIRNIATIGVVFIALLVVSNFRSVRYAVPVMPAFCLLLALLFWRFLKQPSLRPRTIAALVILLIAGFVHSKIRINVWRRNMVDERMIAEKLGTMQEPGVRTVLIKAQVPGNDLMRDSFYLFHGNCRFPVVKLMPDEIRTARPKAPLIGASVVRDFPVVQELYPNVQVELARAQFICWRVPGQ